MNFKKKLDKIVNKNNSLLCIGLDPELENLPEVLQKEKDPLFVFNKAIIDATHDIVCAYKPNIAFYEAYGLEGLLQLQFTIRYLIKNHPEIPIILDAKRGDIGNTASCYAKAVFEFWQADAVTVFPYMGLDTIKPFLAYQDNLTIVLIRTSNPDARMFQDLKVGKDPLYLKIAQEIKNWDFENLGIFVGATYPEELSQIRKIFPDKIFLSAGIGAQSAQIKAAVQSGIDKQGEGIMFNASRSIIYASSGKDFSQKARAAAMKLRDEINKHRYKL